MKTNQNENFSWNLRSLMASKGMFQTTDMQRALSEQGLQLSREQVYRIVTKAPARLNLDVLVALCRILECSPGDLIEVHSADRASLGVRDTGTTGPAIRKRGHDVSPVSARIRRPRS